MSLRDHIHDKVAATETIKHVRLAKPEKRRPFAIATLGGYYVTAVAAKGGPESARTILRTMRFKPDNVPSGCKGDTTIVKAYGLLHRDAHGRVVIEASAKVTSIVFKTLKREYFPHLKTRWLFKAIVLRRLKDGDGGDEFTDTDAEVATAEADSEAVPSPGDDEIMFVDEFDQKSDPTPVAAAAATAPQPATATPAQPRPATATTPPPRSLPEVPEVPGPPPLDVTDYLGDMVEHVMGLSGIVMPDGLSEDEKQGALAGMSTNLRKLLERADEKGILDDAHVNHLIDQIRDNPKGDAFRRPLLGLPASAGPKEYHAKARSVWVPAYQAACLVPSQFKAAVEAKLQEVGEVFGEGEETWSNVDRLSSQINAMSFPPLEDGEADMRGAVQRAQDVLTAQAGVLEQDQELTDFIDNMHSDVEAATGGLREFLQAIAASKILLAKIAV